MTESAAFAHKKAELKDIFSGEKCAIVTPMDSSFGMARIHDSLIQVKDTNIDTMVFRDFNEALEWLGVALDDDDLMLG